jgi:hypothetical protein
MHSNKALLQPTDSLTEKFSHQQHTSISTVKRTKHGSPCASPGTFYRAVLQFSIAFHTRERFNKATVVTPPFATTLRPSSAFWMVGWHKITAARKRAMSDCLQQEARHFTQVLYCSP